MKYYKWKEFTEPLKGGFTYIELEDGTVLRQITVLGGEVHVSNERHPEWGFVMCDQILNDESIEEMIAINQDEFIRVWNTNLENKLEKWHQTKSIYSIGTEVKGHIEVFYPQGTLISFGSDVIGIVETDEIRDQFHDGLHSTGLRISGSVIGYDDDSQWVVLGDPKLLSD